MRNQTIELNGAYIESAFSSVGSKESQGPLKDNFDKIFLKALKLRQYIP